MGLLYQTPSWGKCTTNLPATPLTGAPGPGTVVTAGASNADGSTATLVTNLTHDVEMLGICISGFFTSTAARATLLDILIDRAGGTTWDTTNILINDLLCGQTQSITAVGACGIWYWFPLWIPGGSSLGARARNSTASTQAGSVVVHCYGANRNRGTLWTGQTVETIGITAASSAGTSHTPGSTGTYSSWTNIGSTQVGPSGAVQFGLQRETTTTTNLLGYDWEFGIGSTRVGPNIWASTASTEAIAYQPMGPIFYHAPNGTQWQCRATCSGTAQAFGVGIYVVH